MGKAQGFQPHGVSSAKIIPQPRSFAQRREGWHRMLFSPIIRLRGVMDDPADDAAAEKKAPMERSISEAKFRRLFEDSRQGVFVSAPEGSVLEANPAYLRMFGFPADFDIKNIDIRNLMSNPTPPFSSIDFEPTERSATWSSTCGAGTIRTFTSWPTCGPCGTKTGGSPSKGS